ncbi:MAG: protein kinase, partial [Candidatus Latescibacterota bacterium]
MIGDTISHYRILEELGAGGMGVVYKAEDTNLKRTVALKFLPEHLLGTEQERSRFVREAQAAAALDHPNICTIHEIDTVDDRTFIAMAYVSGETLEARVEKGPLKLDDAVGVALDLCDALGESHAKGVVHRDIKPANIMISERGRAIVMDFGLAKLKGQTKLTRDGATVGTVSYMSPEQAQGIDVDHRTDIWSLGVVLYQMITGQLPFKGDHESAVVYSIVNEEPDGLTALRSGVPLELERIVNKALAKNAVERYQHIDDLRVDLKRIQECLGKAPSTVTGSPRKPTKRRRWYLAACSLALLALLAVIVIWLGSGGGPRVEEQPTSATEGRTDAPSGQRENSIAVLPLDNLSGVEENEFFADGMTEELITQLAQIQALKVISRTSVMRYKGTDKPLSTIANELNVSTILEGSVLWVGNRVRINAQLIDGASDEHLWANSYESDLSDVLGLQRSVAKEVARQIRVELTSQEEDRLAGSPVVNRDAYELYLKGRFWWNKRTRAGIQKAIEFFQRAIEIVPDYALAYAGLGECYVVLGTWAWYTPPNEIYPKASEYAKKALEIDPNLAPAHAVLAGIAKEYENDWDKAEAHYRRAIELNPNYATARQWYAEFLGHQGRYAEAIEQVKTALEL